MIDRIMYRLGFVRIDRARGWVDAAMSDEKVRGADRLSRQALRFNRYHRHEKRVAYQAGVAVGRSSRVDEEVQKIAGVIAAERDGYKAQLGQSERKLRTANRSLEAQGKMPVTSFIY